MEKKIIEERKPPIRYSKGIILCKYDSKRIRILLTKRRYTYAFCDFVHGHYSKEEVTAIKSSSGKVNILANMTHEELLDIWSLNFEQMWYRIWISFPNRELYIKKNVRFQSNFIKDDGGRSLRNAITNTRSNNVILWDIPKGRKLFQTESNIICAIRELEEEMIW